MKYLLIWLGIINIVGLYAMYLDKRKAAAHRWRIPEKTLFAIALFGGSAGCLAGMYLFRHKTKHLAFVLGVPLILLFQITAALVLNSKLNA